MKKTQAGISTHVCTRRTGSLLIYAIITESRMSSTPHAACAAARIPRRFRGLTCFSFCVYCESELVVSAANLFHTESLPKKKKKKKKNFSKTATTFLPFRLSSYFKFRPPPSDSQPTHVGCCLTKQVVTRTRAHARTHTHTPNELE